MTTNFEERKKRWIRDTLIGLLIEVGDEQPSDIAELALLTARHFNVRREDMRSDSKFWIDVAARAVAAALTSRFTRAKLVDISEYFRHDHSTTSRAMRRYNDVIDAVIDEISKTGAIRIPPRRKPPKPRCASQLSRNERRKSLKQRQSYVLERLAKVSVDGVFTAPEDVVPTWKQNAATVTLNSLVNEGYAEVEPAQDCNGAPFFRISDRGCELLAAKSQHEDGIAA